MSGEVLREWVNVCKTTQGRVELSRLLKYVCYLISSQANFAGNTVTAERFIFAGRVLAHQRKAFSLGTALEWLV